MNERWRIRTSLFARMSLLFGLLVTVPLVISGLVLSLAGQRVVLESGDRVAGIGRTAVDAAAQNFNTVADRALQKATGAIVAVGKKRLASNLDEAVDAGKGAVAKNTTLATQRGQQAVQQSTGEMEAVARDTIDESVNELRTLNEQALSQLHGDFQTSVRRELDGSTQSIREELYKSVKETWQLSADSRALSVTDYVSRCISDLTLKMQYPLRTRPIRSADDDRAVPMLNRIAKPDKSFPQIARVVLVNQTGTEIARVPPTDVPRNEEGEEGDDWAETGVRRRLLRSPSAVIEEPALLDPRSKSWVKRIAHKVIDSGDSEVSESSPLMGEPQPTRFVVVDFKLNNVAELATSDKLKQGMLVMVIDGETGSAVSVHPRREDGSTAAIVAAVADYLKTARSADDAEKPQSFSFRTGDTGWQASARYWGSRDKLWTVVAQQDADVFTPVSKLEEGIKRAWGSSLGKVNTGMGAFVKQRSARADSLRQSLSQKAKTRLTDTRQKETAKVAQVLSSYRTGLVKNLESQLGQTAAKLEAQADQDMDRERQQSKSDAAREFQDRSRTQAELTSSEIASQARDVANRTAGQMFLNSAWLIPLFLILALFLATLTARSLVRPINQLVKGTQALASGDYDQRIKVRGDDELARLAGAFNTMAGAIQVGQAELQQSHASLAAEKARIEGIVQASPDGLVMLEPGGQVALMNPTSARLLDLKPSQIPPVPFELSQLPEGPAARLRECLDRAAAGEGVQEYEVAEPERRVLQLRDVALRAADGRSFGHLLHLHDITRERVIDEMKSDFISLVSHELRTPLTSILGFSSYMLTGRLGEVKDTQRTALESIHRQAKRLSAIISDFLDVSRIESGKIEMKKEEVAVPNIAGRVIEDLRPQAAEKSVRVSAQAQEGPYPLVALGDEQRIAQVLTNLVGNSLKFTEAGGAIDVVLSRQNGEVLCQVRDTGCGIPPDELDRVFDRFYQVEKVVTRKSGGTGLGLAIVKNIIEAHGGRIWIASEPGKGTEVSFTLPGAE